MNTKEEIQKIKEDMDMVRSVTESVIQDIKKDGYEVGYQNGRRNTLLYYSGVLQRLLDKLEEK